MKNHKRLLVSQCKYTKTPMSKFECFGHAVKGQCYTLLGFKNVVHRIIVFQESPAMIDMDIAYEIDLN